MSWPVKDQKVEKERYSIRPNARRVRAEGVVGQERLALFHFLKISNNQKNVDFKYREIYCSEQILDSMVINLRNAHCNKVLVEIICLPPGQAASPLTKANQLSRRGEFSKATIST
jgi:hypothetical protein